MTWSFLNHEGHEGCFIFYLLFLIFDFLKGAQGIPTYAPSMEEQVGACRPCPHARGIR
jgi:hypothetical protein